MLRIGSLCTGTGMMDMAVQNVLGGELAWVADPDKYVGKLLDHRFPGIPNLGDLTKANWDEAPDIDVLTAGFPCQPVSDAGRQLGIKDERWIFPDIIRAIRGLRPELVILENVVALLGRGFPEVSGSLAEIGYDCKWTSVRATAVGACHRRERLFVAAYPGGARLRGSYSGAQPYDEPATGSQQDGLQAAVNAGSARLQGCAGQRLPVGQLGEGHSPADWWGDYATAIKQWESILGRPAPFPVIQRPKPGAVTTRINPKFSEWMMGMPEGWVTDVPGLLIKRQLMIIGNSVIQRQAEFALRELLEVSYGNEQGKVGPRVPEESERRAEAA